jgi:HK97 family phage major capsid protein
MTSTTAAGQGWAPNVVSTIPLDDALPDSFLVLHTTFAGTVEGDAPTVRVPFVGADPTASTVAEAATIPLSDVTLDELVISTKKSAVLTKLSNELAAQAGAKERIALSLQRALTKKANADYVASLIEESDGFVDAGELGNNLDAFVDALADIEANGGEATHIVMNADAWKTISKIKVATGSNQALVAAREILGIPVALHASADAIYVTSKADLGSAYSPLRIMASLDRYMDEDALGYRGTVRFGVKPARPNRHAKITLPTED